MPSRVSTLLGIYRHSQHLFLSLLASLCSTALRKKLFRLKLTSRRYPIFDLISTFNGLFSHQHITHSPVVTLLFISVNFVTTSREKIKGISSALRIQFDNLTCDRRSYLFDRKTIVPWRRNRRPMGGDNRRRNHKSSNWWWTRWPEFSIVWICFPKEMN